jgi:hypothetical protein
VELNLQRSGPWIGFGGLAVLLFIAFPAIMPPLGFAPWWGVLMILGLLVLQGIVIARLAKRRPERCAFVPLFGLLAYFALLFAGIRWWNWAL